MTEVLAFDVGDDIVGIIDLRSDAYDRYRGPRMPDGARRILDCGGVVVSFNGILYDMPELARIVGIADADTLPLKGTHCDMRIHACRDRYPPPRDEEDTPILGPDLWDHYRYYFGRLPPDPPDHLDDDYERNNWRDCYMAGELWRRLKGRCPPMSN